MGNSCILGTLISKRSSGPPLVVRAIAMMFSTLLGVAELIVLILGVVLCVLLPLGPFVMLTGMGWVCAKGRGGEVRMSSVENCEERRR